MKRTLLFLTLAATASMTFAQRVPGRTNVRGTIMNDGSRANDTIYSAAFDAPGATIAVYGVIDNGGYILGTNSYGDKAKAQAFLLDAPTAVEEVLFWFGAKSDASGNPNSTFAVNIYAMDGPGFRTPGSGATATPTNDAPGTILGTLNLSPSVVDTTWVDGVGFNFTVAAFPSPIYVNTEFAAGIDVSNLAPQDTVAMASTLNGEVEFGEFCWEKWSDNTWYTLPGAGWGSGTFDVDAAVFVVIDNESIGIEENGSMNNLRMSFLNGNISNGTVQIGYDVVKAGRISFLVHDSKGRVVLQADQGNQGVGYYTHTFSTEGWAAGNYYVTLRNNGMPLTKKMVVR
jgi:hypothetical protein